ncbi:hypothetical protein [Aquabacterium sp.]|uniref:hypothetical protein n=1 Tax=Aquabacterium sp. TaxID=1872578 RepID=UPI0025C68E41|nr:hypothetical protein [Aquabacterium sp.]
MTLPYEKATSGEKALGEIQKILRAFGCNKFGSMADDEEQTIMVQFEYRGRQCTCKASIRGYAAAYLKEHPPTIYNTDLMAGRGQAKQAAAEKKALEVASVAVYSILRDWIKGQVMAIETGVLTFEGAFLGQIMLPSGKTVLQHVEANKMLALEHTNG